uniref:Replication protein n=1 Tax=Lactococcus lactis subsp. lactis TaxID=1360 RepID=A0AAJ4T313_LACLL|nr:replication protein [Lactococcus lactis subsp. lactis]
MEIISKNERNNNERTVCSLKEIEKRKIVEHNDLITSVAKMDKVPLKIFELAVSLIDTDNPPKNNTIYLSKTELFAGPFMVATKIKGMVAAEVSDERSAYMTRGHNNARMITVGAEIVGDELAKNIAKAFVNGKYDGGRHQVRVDMLNKMC